MRSIKSQVLRLSFCVVFFKCFFEGNYNLNIVCFYCSGLFDRDHYVLKFMMLRGIPCATVIGGGYSRDLNALSRRHTIVHRAASKVTEV